MASGKLAECVIGARLPPACRAGAADLSRRDRRVLRAADTVATLGHVTFNTYKDTGAGVVLVSRHGPSSAPQVCCPCACTALPAGAQCTARHSMTTRVGGRGGGVVLQ